MASIAIAPAPGGASGPPVPAAGAGGPPTPKGVSAAEIAAAASPGNSKAQIKARKKLAKRFYKEQGGMSAAEARNHMRGIDFNKPVTIGPLPLCPSPQAQWQAPGGRRGQYYADPGSSPDSVGIHDKGATMGLGGWGTGPAAPKTSTSYNVPPSTPYMQSTAAPVKDTWSVPGHSYGTSGGGTQRYVSQSAANSNGVSAIP